MMPPALGVNIGHGWVKVVATITPDEAAEATARLQAERGNTPLPDGVQAPHENEIEVVFPSLTAEAGPQSPDALKGMHFVQWDQLYAVGEDALFRVPRAITAQSRLDDPNFIPVLVRGAMQKLQHAATVRLEHMLAAEAQRANKTAVQQLRQREEDRGGLPEQMPLGNAVTGLPATWVALKGKVLGAHLRKAISTLGKSRVIEEPLALFYAEAIDHCGRERNAPVAQGRHAVVDMGYLSVDLAEIYNRQAVTESFDTLENGASTALRQIRAQVSAHFDRQFQPYEIDMAVRHGGAILVGNRMCPLPSGWDQPLIKLGHLIVDALVDRWRSGNQFESVIIGGGLAAEPRIAEPLLARFNNAHVVARPQTAVARGYSRLAMVQAQRAAGTTPAREAPVLPLPKLAVTS